MKVVCLPEEDPNAALLAPIAERAAGKLELERHLSTIRLCLDDPEADERAWFALRSDRRDRHERHRLTLYVSPDQVVADKHARSSTWPPRVIWDLRAAPADEPPPAAKDFSSRKAAIFINHQFLLIRDLCDGTVDLEEVPRGLAEAFQAAWAVTIDTRLRHQGLACLSVAIRRGIFSRLFAAAGVLLPEHWRIFHELTVDTSPQQEKVLQMLKRLPRLRERKPGI